MSDDLTRIQAMREKLFKWTRKAIDDGSCHKASECSVTVEFPGMFDVWWTISVYSYVLGPHRNHEFTGKTFDEVMTIAEYHVDEWCAKYDEENGQ